MPLTTRDQRFLQTINRLKIYLVLLALAVFLYLVFTPSSEIQMATSIIGMALCGVFWLTQRLLSYITQLDLELTRIVNVLRATLPEEKRKELFGSP